MLFEIVGSFITILLFLFSYKQLKTIRHHDTNTYFDGLDGLHAISTHESGSDM
ncbi:hypothetical protein ACO11K_000402 [Bacillus cytotoxicus]|uniref:hypothetical protein n=1 Tax=unclassified Bacillus cereus group TaxID=2750818 RepID=UPI001F5AA239|nr:MULTISPECIES: hypothetical protein [unclassified Bacillus cereus group]EMA6342136.1 hypothetical protein [Bacillus cytotoxicus]